MFTQRLAEFVINTDINDIPSAVLEGSRHALTDTIGCALGGAGEPVATIARRWVEEEGTRQQAAVWGSALRASPADAALANGVASHALDFDDAMATLRGHPSATLAPCAIAVGEAAHSSGAAVLGAFATGLEVVGKLGQAVGDGHYLRGWHTTATMGAFASAAVAARLWGLDVGRLQTAWGLAAAQASGVVRNFGTMAKPFQAGHAARTGVISAWLAREGFTADPAIFDGKNSFIEMYNGGDETLRAKLVERLGKPWEMLEPGICVKRWPCCYANHRPIGGVLKLMEQHAIAADEVEGVEIGFLPASDTALIYKNPQTGLEGKFSIEYVAAALLLDRKLTLETFTDAMVQRPQIRQLMAKVHRYPIAGQGTFSGLVGYTDVAIATKRGRFSARVEHTPGSPAWPLSEADRAQKFLDCAERALGSRAAPRLLDLLGNVAALPDIAALAQATMPGG